MLNAAAAAAATVTIASAAVVVVFFLHFILWLSRCFGFVILVNLCVIFVCST